MAKVEFWLISGSVQLRLPVNPESFAYSSPFNYEELEVAGLGDVTNIGYRGLKEFTIETFWPKFYNPAYCNYSGFRSPDSFVETIEKWRNQRSPIRYVVTGVKGANYLVTIRDFQVEAERAGSPGDVYFTLALKEFRQAKVNVVDTSKPKAVAKSSSRPQAASKTLPSTYTVKAGDSLWTIAKRLYGDGNKKTKLYDANKKAIGKNPNNLTVSMKLAVPK